MHSTERNALPDAKKTMMTIDKHIQEEIERRAQQRHGEARSVKSLFFSQQLYQSGSVGIPQHSMHIRLDVYSN